MPDGVVSASKGPAPVTAFSSPQWQSFEMRMRKRRAERCLQRARDALEAGLIDDSVKAFTEAQQLDPAGAGVLEFAQQLSAWKDPAPFRPSDRLSRLSRFAALASLLMALSGLIGWWTLHRSGEVQETAPSQADIRLESVAPVTTLPMAPANAAREPDIQDAPAPVPAPSARPAASLRRPAPVERPAIGQPPGADAGAIGTVGLDVAPRKTDPAPPPRETLAPTPSPLPTTELVLPPSGIPSAPAPSPLPPVNSRAAATAPVSPVASPPDQRGAIRATLGRYETAYSELDVTAVQAVWPALDQRALARAFDSLVSQQVSLENCSVEIDGGTARANCSGTAAWTPKVGGGLRTATRKWVFDLSQSEGAWHIVRVEAR